MVPLGGLPAGDAVATDAVDAGGNVHACLASGSTSVVATGAHGGRCKQTVVGLGAQPGAGGLVAALANRLAVVNGSRRAAAQTVTGAHMAGRTLGGQRHIVVELAWYPAGVARLVAAVAVGDGGTG